MRKKTRRKASILQKYKYCAFLEYLKPLRAIQLQVMILFQI